MVLEGVEGLVEAVVEKQGHGFEASIAVGQVAGFQKMDVPGMDAVEGQGVSAQFEEGGQIVEADAQVAGMVCGFGEAQQLLKGCTGLVVIAFEVCFEPQGSCQPNFFLSDRKAAGLALVEQGLHF